MQLYLIVAVMMKLRLKISIPIAFILFSNISTGNVALDLLVTFL